MTTLAKKMELFMPKTLYKSEEKPILRLKDFLVGKEEEEIHVKSIREGKTKNKGVEVFYLETDKEVIIVYKNNSVGKLIEQYKEDLWGHDFTIKVKSRNGRYYIKEVVLDDTE